MKTKNIFFLRLFLFVISLSFAGFFTVNSAHAVTDVPSNGSSIYDDELTCTLDRVVKTLTGPMGKAIASIAIIALGIGLFMGKLSWGLAVATALGIAMIFGADSIVNWLSGNYYVKIHQPICRSL